MKRLQHQRVHGFRQNLVQHTCANFIATLLTADAATLQGRTIGATDADWCGVAAAAAGGRYLVFAQTYTHIAFEKLFVQLLLPVASGSCQVMGKKVYLYGTGRALHCFTLGLFSYLRANSVLVCTCEHNVNVVESIDADFDYSFVCCR